MRRAEQLHEEILAQMDLSKEASDEELLELIHRILEAQEQPQPCPVLDGHRQQVAAQKLGRPFGDGELFIARQHRRQRRLARTVRSHDGMHLTGLHFEVDAPENLLAVDRGVQIFYL